VRRLAIIGGGAWGTALAIVVQRAGGAPTLWARDGDVVTAINERHENPLFLPGVTLDPLIAATPDIGAVVGAADAALIAVPAQFLRAVILTLRPILRSGFPVLICAKGIEVSSLKTMSEV
jgi:glycerol-3-phosphate dehydrogenase (NAD(P)+)